MTDVSRTRQRRSREEWQQLIGEQRQSGLGQKAFCKERGLALSTFTYWKRRIGNSADTQHSEGNWLELPVGISQDASSGWDIELDLGGGVCLRLRQR
mgnify:CR=1 FL=1